MTPQLLERKRFSPDIKLGESGAFRAVIATLGVIDKDGDVTLKGFFGEQKNIPVLVGHDWGMIPVGKGRIFEDGDKAIIEAQLNLKDDKARDVYEWLKFDIANGEPAQEFSYGFSLKDDGWKPGDFEGQRVRFLQPTKDGEPGAKIHEASLVLVGAGEGTGTQNVKGTKFSDHVETVLAAVREFAIRARSLADLRAKDGRSLSDDNLTKIRELRDELSGIVDEAAEEPTPDLPSHEQIDLLMAQTELRIAGRI